MPTMTPYLRRRVTATSRELEAIEPGYTRVVRGVTVTRDHADPTVYAAQACGRLILRGSRAQVAAHIHRTHEPTGDTE